MVLEGRKIMNERLYLRASSPNQKESGQEIELDRKRITSNPKYNISKIHIDDGISAGMTEEKDFRFELTDDELIVRFKILKREEFSKILHDSMKEKFKLIIPKWDRFSRFLPFQELCLIFLNQNGVEVESDAEPSSNNKQADKIVRRVLGTLGEDELDRTKIRMDNFRQSRFEQGYYCGSKVKFGFKWMYDEAVKDKPNTLIPANDQNTILAKKVLDLALGLPHSEQFINTISRQVGVEYAIVRNILRDPYYCGFVTYNGEIRKGVHDGLISVSDFLLIQKKIGNEELIKKINQIT